MLREDLFVKFFLFCHGGQIFLNRFFWKNFPIKNGIFVGIFLKSMITPKPNNFVEARNFSKIFFLKIERCICKKYNQIVIELIFEGKLQKLFPRMKFQNLVRNISGTRIIDQNCQIFLFPIVSCWRSSIIEKIRIVMNINKKQ